MIIRLLLLWLLLFFSPLANTMTTARRIYLKIWSSFLRNAKPRAVGTRSAISILVNVADNSGKYRNIYQSLRTFRSATRRYLFHANRRALFTETRAFTCTAWSSSLNVREREERELRFFSFAPSFLLSRMRSGKAHSYFFELINIP